MKPLPERCCGRCKHWTRRNPEDMTAPEGKCGLRKDPCAWPAYWPHTLQRDVCRKMKPAFDPKAYVQQFPV